ncbi:RNA 2'-phosphotransferase, Tpt1 [Xylaria sp. CBS 124048]|nr:RNA 2'-phosphotransferase, Tpt1 [Xylaria sp. CBS 124048]
MADDTVTTERVEVAETSKGRGGRGRGRGGGGRGGGGGGGGGRGGTTSRQVQISKALSKLLRHQAQNAGMTLDSEGFVPLDKVMQWLRFQKLQPTLAEIKEEVATNAKQRFSMKPKESSTSTDEDDEAYWLIRANQGHSIALASEGLHTPVTLEAGNIPNVVVHGTYFAFWPAIVAAGGLKKMNRTHVHFGTGLPDGDAGGSPGQVHGVEVEDEESSAPVISGMRADAEILVFVDVERALREDEGMKWWISENRVVLTEGNAEGLVPLKYFKEVRGRRQGVGLLWKDGEKVADLPDGNAWPGLGYLWGLSSSLCWVWNLDVCFIIKSVLMSTIF